MCSLDGSGCWWTGRLWRSRRLEPKGLAYPVRLSTPHQRLLQLLVRPKACLFPLDYRLQIPVQHFKTKWKRKYEL